MDHKDHEAHKLPRPFLAPMRTWQFVFTGITRVRRADYEG